MADTPPDAFTVRILGPDGQLAGGLGALVGERHVVTCAHVVNAALGLDPSAQHQPTDRVLVMFPLLPGPVVEADVVMWRPPPAPGIAGDDIAGLLIRGDLPGGAAAARLAVETPQAGHAVRVFGYPTAEQRPDGEWVGATVRGAVGNGRLQLDSLPDSAGRVQPGYSGSPVVDDAIGRVVGLVVMATEYQARDSYAISADRLRLAWPEVLAGRWQSGARAARRREADELTILHVSDLRFDSGRRSPATGPTGADRAEHPLFGHLHADLAGLARSHGLRPDLLVVTGNLAGRGMPSEFRQASEFLAALAEEAEIPRRHVVIVPGDQDINRQACQAYFAEQESNEEEPVPPYWPKWRQYADAFRGFYAGLDSVTFTPDEPWTLFEMPDLNVVVAGLNSTMADSHREADHYGQVGGDQLQWFANRLARHRYQGWLRLAAVHHHDVADLDQSLGQRRLVNLLLHGHSSDAELHHLPSGLIALSCGRAAIRYQLVTVRRDGFTRSARQYAPGEHRWAGDTTISPTGSQWRVRTDYEVTAVDKALPPPPAEIPAGLPRRFPLFGDQPNGRHGGSSSDFFDRVADATRARATSAIVTERPDAGYLRVTVSEEGGRVEQWPVGVIDGPATEETIGDFVARVHSQFAAEDPTVRSELVYRMPAASGALVQFASRHGVLLRSLVEYQGLVDLRPLAEAQRERLASDRIYPARMYVDQRYRIVSGGGHGNEIRTELIDRAVQWLGAEGARLVVVLGDFGRGKTSFLRQLTRVLPSRLAAVTPVLVELRSLEKAPSLDELLAQHLVRQNMEDISPGKLRHMISSGRIALLLDGFDELELRVGYENASEYLQRLLDSVTGQAKVIMTSRTQHFRSTEQVRSALTRPDRRAHRTALGERVETRPESRVVVLEDFSDDQILRFLANLYEGDSVRAAERFDLISGIGNLLDLAHNPRMLAFVADLDEDRLRAAQDASGQISPAGLYGEIIDFWLEREAERQQHRGGLRSIDSRERFAACTALALRLWASKDPTIALHDLSAEVTATLTGLAERGYTEDQAVHSIASGSLLVRTDEGAFSFIHQSIMEWLVARAAADDLLESGNATILGTRRMSRVMAAFFADLAGQEACRAWVTRTLAEGDATQAAKQNGLDIDDLIGPSAVNAPILVSQAPAPPTVTGPAPALPTLTGPAPTPPTRQNLAGIDLRGQDLTGRDLRGANLRGANLSGMRLDEVDLSGADLSEADLTGVVMTEGSLSGAVLTRSRWNRAAIVGTKGVSDTSLARGPELATASIVGLDRADVVVDLASGAALGVAFSPDGTLLAYGSGRNVKIARLTDGKVLRILRGHISNVNAVAFSPDGTLIATASDDHTARTWTTAIGTHRTTLTGHDRSVNAVAFSPDGTLIATASDDHTARTWDTATGTHRTTLTGHTKAVRGVAFSPDGILIATASTDCTARTWDTATGTHRTTLPGHDGSVNAVAFSPDGTLIATASDDGTARTWDTATGTVRTIVTGHTNAMRSVAFSPDGTLIATASDDGTARTWDTATGTVRTIVTGHGHNYPVNAVAFSPDGTLIATASTDYTASTWDTATGTRRTTLIGHTNPVQGVAFSPDGTLIATGSTDCTARTWDTATGTHRTTLPGHDGTVTAVAFSPDSTLVATASTDRTARIWDLTASRTASTLWRRRLEVGRLQHDGTVNAVAFSPDGILVATASDDGTARIWDTATGTHRTTLTRQSGWVSADAFSPDGTLIATASDDGTAHIWDTATGTRRITLAGSSATVSAVAFSPDVALIATASDDGTAHIWDTATGAPLATLVALSGGGYATLLFDGSYKLHGEPGDDIWWAIKLCRFQPGELDPYVSELRRLEAGERILPHGQ